MIQKLGKTISLLLFLVIPFSIDAQNNNIVDKVVWIVGDEAILRSDIESARLNMLSMRQRIEGDPYCFIPEQLAVSKLYLDQAKVDSLKVESDDVKRQVARYEQELINNEGGGSRERLEEYRGMNINQIREMLFEEIKTNHLTEQVQKSLTKDIRLTPSEVRKFYAQLPEDSLPYIETSVEVQIFTNNPQIPLKEIDVIKGRLRDFREKILSGETDFSILAISYSEDNASAIQGGELDFMGRAVLDPAFASVGFSLSDPKKVSNIVETEFGYHIIQLIERRGDRAKFRHILLRPKVPQEEIQKSKDRLVQIADSIRSNVFSFEEAAEFLSFDKDTRGNGGLMVNHIRTYEGPVTTSKFKMEELAPEISRVVDTMKVGQLSTPFVMKNEKGKDVVAFVKLKSRVDGHFANVSDDYEDLRQIVEANKREEALKKWVQRKIKDVYVYIDPEWRNCDYQYEGWLDDIKNNN